ncbi:MAG: HAMP domain-containing sensor histidine kinase [Candidatus Binatus sp.]|uniref:sensor histidine kinase n=1 Tax=Candidatus Binatus sp. TaxID=2811406 RepID=UPI002721C371|nr:HAMP domain-containing sensor histidine kinase [Candidatus Binatus sp.]MDO8431868.1 HAMP domain-containing sensor histidine kinase [Candidatus Binatus sp.]
MRLSEFIRANVDKIVHEWEEFAKTLSAGKALPRWILRDHAPAIVKYIADDMDVPQAPLEEEAKSKGGGPSGPIEHVATVHVSLRIESGFDLVQIMAEYRALRSCVLRLWRQSYAESFAGGAEEITRFAEAIDQNVAEAVPYYEERETHFRDRFLGILGHDLRGPLNAITVGASLLATNGLNERQLGTVSRISNSARRLNRMVSDLLDFSRGRLGSPMPIAATAANLGQLVSEVVNEVQTANPQFIVDFDSNGDLEGHWDVERLKQVVSNLLLNAIHHGSGKEIRVTATGEKTSVVLAVQNEGPPIPTETQATMFDPLVQGKTPDPTRVGLGLGLFIVNEIVAAHHGTIVVTSTEDAGTTFCVRLPRRLS